jgi:hypothetical protein
MSGKYDFEIENTKADWKKHERNIISAFLDYAKEKRPDTPITFNILMSHNYALEQSDQNNLNYFFIFHERLVRILEHFRWSADEMKKVHLNLSIVQAEQEWEGDFHAEDYLSYMVSVVRDDRISFDFHSTAYKYQGNTKTDHILFRKSKSRICKRLLPQSKLRVQCRTRIRGIGKRARILLQAKPRILGRILPLIRVKGKKECDALMNDNQTDITDITNKILSAIRTNNKTIANRTAAAFSPETQRSLHDFYGKRSAPGILCYLFIGNMTKILIGNELHLWEKAKGGALFECFAGFVETDVCKHGILTKAIWSLIVRFASGTGFPNKELSEVALRGFLERTLMSAQAYAEGIYQLVENSVSYSASHIGYFSLSINEGNPNSSVRSRSVKVAQYRLRLESKYSIKPFLYRFDDKAQYYLAIHISDDGIALFDDIDKIADKGCRGIITQYKERLPGINSLTDAFRPKRDASSMIHHYGLPTFFRIILVNGGIFSIYSPHDSQSLFESDPDQYTATLVKKAGMKTLFERSDLQRETLRTVTEYEIMLPVYLEDREGLSHVEPNFKEHLYQNFKEHLYQINTLDDLMLNSILGLKEVKDAVATILGNDDVEKWKVVEERAKEYYGKYFEDVTKEYLYTAVFDGDMHYLHIEIFAKFLMKAIVKIVEDHPEKRIAVALLFEQTHYMYEFVRIFTAFFDFAGKNAFLDKVQIALLGNGNDNQMPSVNLVLAGKNIRVARDTARLFAYFNADDSLHIIPHIDYLTEIKMDVNNRDVLPHLLPYIDHLQTEIKLPVEEADVKNNALPSLFPFELRLCKSDFNERRAAAPDLYRTNSLFYERLDHELSVDIRSAQLDKPEPGYLIGDSLIRLGSNIHIEKFYQAELLLQNIGNTYRFACILAQYIKTLDTSEHWILVGYEYYSELLLKETELLLNEEKSDLCKYCIVPSDADMRIKFPDEKSLEGKDDVGVLVVMPIGTTLTTFYKIRNRIKDRPVFEGKKINKAFVFVLVAEERADGKEKTLSRRYYTEDLANKSIILEKADNSSADVNVAYYLRKESIWHDPDEALRGDAGRRALVGVDNTSLLPNAIFRRSGQHIMTFLEDREGIKENNKRLCFLENCIVYGHVAKGANHFQFYIDTPQMYL